MTAATSSTDPLVEALATRLRLIDVVAWQRIAAWAEEAGLSFADLRLLLALAQKVDDGRTEVTELARLAGFSLGTAYPAIRSLTGRGYLLEERRHYSLSEHGLKLVAAMDGTHREGIQTYVDRLDRDERERLRTAFAESNHPPHRKEQS